MKVLVLCLIVLIIYGYWPYPDRVHAANNVNNNDNANVKIDSCPRAPQIGGVAGPIVEKEQFCALAVSIFF